MNKSCTICKQNKDVSCYYKHRKRKDGYQNICKDCSSSTSKQYYLNYTEEHKAVTRQKKRERRVELKQQINELKNQLGCATCDEKDSCCLDFHHFDNKVKEYEIATAPSKGWLWEKILPEIKKCVCLCANCHRKVHAGKITLTKDMIYS